MPASFIICMIDASDVLMMICLMVDGVFCFRMGSCMMVDLKLKIEDDVIQITVPHDLAMIIIINNRWTSHV